MEQNISNFTEGAGFNTVPTFQVHVDNKGIQCTVQQTVHMTVSQTVLNRLFGEGAGLDVKINIPVQSVAKANPYTNEN